MGNWKAATILLAFTIPVSGYYAYKLSDRSLPYDRIFGVAHATDPRECGVDEKGELLANPGPYDPDRIHIKDCVRQEWEIDRHKVCNVDPNDPVVRRWLVDKDGEIVKLPIIMSEQVNGQMPRRMSKIFVQPQVPPGWVSYRARVCLACSTDAFLMKGLVNPVHLLRPVCVDHLSTEYRVEASAVR